MRDHQLFHLFREHREPPDLDELLFAVVDGHAPQFIHEPDVTGKKPAFPFEFPYGLRRLLRTVQVFRHYLGSRHHQFAVFPGRKLPRTGLHVHDLPVDSRERQADGADGPEIGHGAGGDRRRGLGQAVSFHQDGPGRLFEPLQNRPVERPRTGDTGPHLPGDGILPDVRVIGDPLKKHLRTAIVGLAIRGQATDGPDEFPHMGRTGKEHHPHAGPDCGIHDGAHGKGMKKRQYPHVTRAVGTHPEPEVTLNRVGHAVEMRQDRGLWNPGGPARHDIGGRIFGGYPDLRRRRGRFQEIQEPDCVRRDRARGDLPQHPPQPFLCGPHLHQVNDVGHDDMPERIIPLNGCDQGFVEGIQADDGVGADLPELVQHLPRLVGGIDPAHHEPQPGAGIVGNDVLEGVGQHQGHHIPLPEAQPVETGGQGVHVASHFAERHGGSQEPHHAGIGIPADGFRHHLVERYPGKDRVPGDLGRPPGLRPEPGP